MAGVVNEILLLYFSLVYKLYWRCGDGQQAGLIFPSFGTQKKVYILEGNQD